MSTILNFYRIQMISDILNHWHLSNNFIPNILFQYNMQYWVRSLRPIHSIYILYHSLFKIMVKNNSSNNDIQETLSLFGTLQCWLFLFKGIFHFVSLYVQSLWCDLLCCVAPYMVRSVFIVISIIYVVLGLSDFVSGPYKQILLSC